MLSEALHSTVDSANQCLLLLGLSSQKQKPNATFNYGQGRGAFYYSLLSAVGMFYAGACVSVWHGLTSIVGGHQDPISYSYLSFAVLGISFVVDSYVLVGALKDAVAQKPPGVSMLSFLRNHNDPFLVTIIVEDSVATFGVLVALVGISLSSIYQNPLFDQISCVMVGLLMGFSAMALASINKQFLLGKSVDLATQQKIGDIVTSHKGIESLYNVKSRWEGPTTFGWKGEVDFNGIYFAQLLAGRYREQLRELVEKDEFEKIELLLEQHSEDVTRAIEMEVFQIQKQIRAEVPQCEWIELTPHSVEHRRFLVNNDKGKQT